MFSSFLSMGLTAGLGVIMRQVKFKAFPWDVVRYIIFGCLWIFNGLMVPLHYDWVQWVRWVIIGFGLYQLALGVVRLVALCRRPKA